MSQDQTGAKSMYVSMSISVNVTLPGTGEDFAWAERALDDETRAEETFP